MRGLVNTGKTKLQSVIMQLEEEVKKLPNHDHILKLDVSTHLRDLQERVEKLETMLLEIGITADYEHESTQVEPDKVTTETPKIPPHYGKDDFIIGPVPLKETGATEQLVTLALYDCFEGKVDSEFLKESVDKIRALLRGGVDGHH